MSTEYRPRIVSWNITGACQLRCPHCFLDASEPWPSELTTREGYCLIDQLAKAGTEMLILSGGEPLLREDLPQLVRHAVEKGLRVVLGTSGSLLDRPTARVLRNSGVMAAGISLDFPGPAQHDAFRGVPGSWQRAVGAMEASRSEGLEVLMHTTALRMNYTLIPEMVRFAHEQGAVAFHLFFLVCTGRGERLTDLLPQEYERLLGLFLDAQERYPHMMLRARCAPYLRRLAYQRGSPLLGGAGCPAASSYCRITPDGEVTPCPYLPVSAGNVCLRPFAEIWQASPALARFRWPQRRLKGKCSQCPFSLGADPLCIGCRARALAVTGDDLAADPWCLYQPSEVSHVPPAGPVPAWSKEALERVECIPSFVRGRVKQAAEAYARSNGLALITPEVLHHLRQRANATVEPKPGTVDRRGM